MANMILEFESRDAATIHVATLMEGALRQSLAQHGFAGLWLSGGSTPGPVYKALSKVDLNWSGVQVGLVDERWEAETDHHSNANLIHATLLQNKASDATFVPMQYGGDVPTPDATKTNKIYRECFTNPPVMLLGMGKDGHTASWFPAVADLASIMSPEATNWVVDLDASRAPLATDTPQRITLTGAAVSYAGSSILFITGEEKRAVLNDAATNLPVHTMMRLLGNRLKIIWAP